MPTRLRLSGAALMGLALHSCDEPRPRDRLRLARAECRDGRHHVASEHFQALLDARDDDTLAFRARRDSIASRSAVGGEEAFFDVMAELNDEFQPRLSAHAMAKIGQDLADANLYDLAFHTVDFAEGYGDAPGDSPASGELLDRIDQFRWKLQQRQANSLRSSLEALGYLTGDGRPTNAEPASPETETETDHESEGESANEGPH